MNRDFHEFFPRLTLPEHIKATDLKWLSVWCRAYQISFGDVFFPKDIQLEDNINFWTKLKQIFGFSSDFSNQAQNYLTEIQETFENDITEPIERALISLLRTARRNLRRN